MKSIAVYTAVFGNYDDLITPDFPEKLKEQADFICFTDNPSLSSDFWQIKRVKRPVSDPVKSNRYFKILSHKSLPDYENVLYVDANVRITTNNLKYIFEEHLSKKPIWFFLHTGRKCLYKEALWVLSKKNIDQETVVREQMQKYIDEGFPENYGLTAGTFILRNNFNPQIQDFNEKWWQEVKNHSRRDQLSLDYVRWKISLNTGFFDGSWEENFIGIRYPHKQELIKKEYRKHDYKLLKKLKPKLICLLPFRLVHYYRYKKNAEYRKKTDINNEFNRIKKIPKYHEFTTEILGRPLKANHKGSFLFLYKELFQQDEYDFGYPGNAPYIIDCGANIGMSLIYLKQKFTEAEIVAFEPDPYLYDLCKFNIESFSLKDIELKKAGLSSEEGSISFYSEGADAGRIARKNDNENIINVQTVKLSSYLNRNVDFLKLDIEGAELEVLEECDEHLRNVKKIFVEYHAFKGEKRDLSRLLSVLEKNNFKYYISTPKVINKKPFKNETDLLGIDFLLNIYAINQNQ